MNMHIYVPSYRRVEQLKTLNWIPDKWLERTTLVVDDEDAKAVRRRFKREKRFWDVSVAVHPKKVDSIAKKRAWIMKHTPHELILMLDDDLRFARRKYESENEITPFKLMHATPADVSWAFKCVRNELETFAHVGISPRQGNNHVTDYRLWKPNTRMVYALGYNVPMLKEAGIKFGRIEHREDMDYTLQLMRKGYENRVLVDVTVDQFYNTKGGASLQRTIEGSNADAEKLAKLHPGLVKVVEKAYERSIPRKEVVCYWRKAIAQGKKRRDD